MIKTEFSEADYARWRATIPFTNNQIADAILTSIGDLPPSHDEFMATNRRRIAAVVSSGKLFGVALRIALPYLVKVCKCCGKKALYRIGSEGRCREHMFVKTAYSPIREKRLEEKQGAREDEDRKRDARMRANEKAHRSYRSITHPKA